MSANAETKTNPVLLALFWLYTGLPLLWGIYSTLIKAADLFK